MSDNLLYYGDNLDVLRRHVKDDPGAPELVYLDPPFKSNQDYPGAPGLACLSNMAPRLVELRRVLKPTDSLDYRWRTGQTCHHKERDCRAKERTSPSGHRVSQ